MNETTFEEYVKEKTRNLPENVRNIILEELHNDKEGEPMERNNNEHERKENTVASQSKRLEV